MYSLPVPRVRSEGYTGKEGEEDGLQYSASGNRAFRHSVKVNDGEQQEISSVTLGEKSIVLSWLRSDEPRRERPILEAGEYCGASALRSQQNVSLLVDRSIRIIIVNVWCDPTLNVLSKRVRVDHR